MQVMQDKTSNFFLFPLSWKVCKVMFCKHSVLTKLGFLRVQCFQDGLYLFKKNFPLSLMNPKDPAVLKTLRDSELLRRSVFTTNPQIYYAADPLRGKMPAIPRKTVSAQGAAR